MSRSIYDIGYKDLIQEQERILSWMRINYRKMESDRQMHPDVVKRRILIHERILKLLEKSKRDPIQADLFAMNQELNK